ncbi:putative membrane protein [Beggiatoa alba B18LD]|uniref:Putative membrane protein n=1 Tax=Beggiatoa alba B18LD TaxID=395493 RepID=I3CFL8_9GAMM|nr:DUF599 domain-containing protein [Beggiatoa alba]EIJ42411.1 putative membrane protein [Beggiatoa alba B18LD]
MSGLEASFTLLAFSVAAAYHLYLYIRMRHTPHSVRMGQINALRVLWIDSVLGGKKDVMVVQTLRNWIMSSSFLASTAIIIALGILNVTLTAEQQHTHEVLWVTKLALLAINFFLGFLNFALAVRLYNHLAFLLNIPTNDKTHHDLRQFVIKTLKRTAYYYNMGMRHYYFSIPLALWLLGSIWLLLGMLGLLFLLYRLDFGNNDIHWLQAD